MRVPRSLMPQDSKEFNLKIWCQSSGNWGNGRTQASSERRGQMSDHYSTSKRASPRLTLAEQTLTGFVLPLAFSLTSGDSGP